MTSQPAEPGTVQRIARDLAVQLRGASIDAIVPIPESHSGFTYRVEAVIDGAPVTAALRLPPPGARLRGPADVVRQGRIMKALSAAGLPAPVILAESADPQVDGRAFVLMDWVDGVRVDVAVATTPMPDLLREACRVARAFHVLPVEATGIGDERPVGACEEVMKWLLLRKRTEHELLPAAEALEAGLLTRAPATAAFSLVHGDYHMGNFLFREGRISAVVDWEIAGISDPVFDFADLCLASIRKPFGESNSGGIGALDLDAVLDVVSEFASVTWHVAACCYKYAVILAYNVMRHRSGKRVDPVYDRMDATIEGLIAKGMEIVR